MSKRGETFERIEGDKYYTPLKAVQPLLPFLKAQGIKSFAEPCRGEGDLVRHLEDAGLLCTYSGDLSDGQDAMQLHRSDLRGPAAIITNPPYSRKVMHPMITHFRKLRPTWLLLEHDWFGTQQAANHLRWCSDIVPIGRVKWKPDSPHESYDSYAWARFDNCSHGTPRYHPRVAD